MSQFVLMGELLINYNMYVANLISGLLNIVNIANFKNQFTCTCMVKLLHCRVVNAAGRFFSERSALFWTQSPMTPVQLSTAI